MKKLNRDDTIQAIINYIKQRKSNEELLLDYYKNHDVFEDYQKLYNIQLYKPNKSKNKKHFIIELFKKDLNDILSEMKDAHLKIKNSNIIKNIKFIQDRKNKKYYLTVLNINCCKNWSIKTMMGIETDTLNFIAVLVCLKKNILLNLINLFLKEKKRK